MDKEFRARSGRTVKPQEDGSIRFGLGLGYLGKHEAMDAEEFFQAKRDEELGRWRSTTDPHWVAVEGERDAYGRRTVTVFDERTFEIHRLNERVCDQGAVQRLGGEIAKHRVARQFFQAYPERKPWADAKPEEVWLMGSGLHEFIALVGIDGKFRFADGSAMAVTETFITGRRIWPEDAS